MFWEERYVRRVYAHTNQGVLVSVQIALVHAMSEGILATIGVHTQFFKTTFHHIWLKIQRFSTFLTFLSFSSFPGARMTLIVSDMLHSMSRSPWDFLVPVISTLIWSLGSCQLSFVLCCVKRYVVTPRTEQTHANSEPQGMSWCG